MWNEKNIEREGLLVVFSSPSGGGKTSIYKALLQKNPQFKYSVSVTTRKPRVGEVDGESYSFVTDEEFQRLISQGKLAEWAEVHDHYYGTRRSYIDSAMKSNSVLLFDLDIQGGLNIRKAYPKNTVLVFILPPTFQELKERLTRRRTESEQDFKLRLKNARKEYNFWYKYDYLVINDVLEKAVEEVRCIIEAERLKSSRVKKIKWNKEED